MTQWKKRSKRGPTGKRINDHRKKRRMDAGRDFLPATIGKPKSKDIRARGGNVKRTIMAADTVNVMNGGKAVKAKIITVKDNAANMQFARRNILAKGSIIETDAGLAKITSRPGQDGTMNAVLVEKKK